MMPLQIPNKDNVVQRNSSKPSPSLRRLAARADGTVAHKRQSTTVVEALARQSAVDRLRQWHCARHSTGTLVELLHLPLVINRKSHLHF